MAHAQQGRTPHSEWVSMMSRLAALSPISTDTSRMASGTLGPQPHMAHDHGSQLSSEFQSNLKRILPPFLCFGESIVLLGECVGVIGVCSSVTALVLLLGLDGLPDIVAA